MFKMEDGSKNIHLKRRSSSLSKFYGSLQHLKTQCKHIYRKCACSHRHRYNTRKPSNPHQQQTNSEGGSFKKEHPEPEPLEQQKLEENDRQELENQKETKAFITEGDNNFANNTELSTFSSYPVRTQSEISLCRSDGDNNSDNGHDECEEVSISKNTGKFIPSAYPVEHKEEEELQPSIIDCDSVKYTQDDIFWFISGERETEVGINLCQRFILPTPPRTPRLSSPIVVGGGGGGEARHHHQRNNLQSNQDFLFKVIPPPNEYQVQPELEEERPVSKSSRPTSAFHSTCSHFIGIGDTGTLCGHTISESSINSMNRDEEYHLKIPSTLRTYSAYSKLVSSRPPSRTGTGTGTFSCIKSKSGLSLSGIPYFETCTTMTTWIEADLNTCGYPYKESYFHQTLDNQISCINWKEYPIGKEVIFIPSWSNIPMKRVPFFPIRERSINWPNIRQRHDQVIHRKKKMKQDKERKWNFLRDLWTARHRVGIGKKLLKAETRILSCCVTEDVTTRFQFIHWLSESSQNPNSIGRFLDSCDLEKRLVAIKICGDKTMGNILDQVRLKLDAVNEINSLIRLDHVNVVKIFTYFEHQSRLHIVLEACDHSLRCEIACSTHKGVPPKMAHGVIYQLLNGLNHCHKLGLLHRHLCPENILVTVDGIIKLADFSKSIFLSSSSAAAGVGCQKREPIFPGNILYGAPELLAHDHYYTHTADIWSIGCILVELLRGRVLWNGGTAAEQLLLIHQTVGPILPQHLQSIMNEDADKSVDKRLRDYFPESVENVISFIEMCFEVDPYKRRSCTELLDHPYIQRGSGVYFRNFQDDSKPASEMLPRMALWELRPHTAPLFHFANTTNLSPQMYDSRESIQNKMLSSPEYTNNGQEKSEKDTEEKSRNTKNTTKNIELSNRTDEDKENQNPGHTLEFGRQNESNSFNQRFKYEEKSTSILNDNDNSKESPSTSLRTKTVTINNKKTQKAGTTVVCSSELKPKNSNSLFISSSNINATRKYEPPAGRINLPHLRIYDRAVMKEQMNGLGYKHLWNNLYDVSAPKALSKTRHDVMMKKGKMTESRRKSLDNLNENNNSYNCNGAGSSCPASVQEIFENSLPTNAKSRIQHIINVLPAANWTTVPMFTTHLIQAAKKHPKTFSAHLQSLTTALLDQVLDSKSKYAGPSIKILSNVCEAKGTFFEPEAERIMEAMLNKLGGPSFIEKEGNEVLRHVVRALKPVKAIIALIKFGGNHKTAAARLSAILLIDETLRKLNLVDVFGLPGEQTATQKRFAASVFRMVTRSLRDTNAHTRIAARDIYQHLMMNHPGFWYLYQTTVPEDKRVWVNRFLEEIRRCQEINVDKKNIKTVGIKNSNTANNNNNNNSTNNSFVHSHS